LQWPDHVQSQTANLLGLSIGFVVGGVALAIVLLTTGTPAPASVPPSPTPAAMTATAAAELAAGAPAPMIRPAELPRIAPVSPSQAETLPNVIYPDTSPDSQGTHKPGTGVAGTGFFVASDGSLLTAAHVVSGCRQTRIASAFVKPAVAELVASDTRRDIALLRAADVTPPATLPIGRPATPDGRLFVLGYPATGGPLIPTETWAELENSKLLPAPAEFTDPRRVIWADAPVINHGFSGGPMLDPRNGEVVGIVRGMVDGARLHATRAAIPTTGMVIGPGSAPLAALLQQEGVDADAMSVSGDDAVETARRATVHILCLY
jgi:S1-C subfamily serine protease